MKFKGLKLAILTLAFASISNAQSVEQLMANGGALLERGAYSQAVTAFRQVVGREPDNFEAQFNLAFAYLQWGRNTNAVEEFKKALQWQPNNSQVWSNLAIAYQNLDKPEESLYSLNQAVKFDPQNITARMNLAATYANANQTKNAITQYKKVLEIDGTSEEALVNLSKCLIGEGQFEEAIKYLQQVAAANPNNGETHFEMANIYWKKKNDLDRALNEYKLSITLTPERPEFYEGYANALVEKGNKPEAIETLKKSLVYIDDVLKKDKVRAQIDKLETGGTASKPAAAEESKLTTKNQIDDLRKELGKGGSAEPQKRIETKPVDVLGDLQDLNEDTTTETLDLKSEAKKRAKK